MNLQGPAELLGDLILLTAILGFGALVARAFTGVWSPLRIASLAFPVGSGLLTWLIFLASWIGLRINLSLTILVLVIGCLVCAWTIRGRRKSPRGEIAGGTQSTARPVPRWELALVWLAAVAGGLLVAVALFISVARSYSLWDSAAIWSVKGYGIALEGSVFAGREWGAHALAYPLNIPLSVGLFALVGGDSLPGSKVLFPLFLASLALGLYESSRRHGVRHGAAALGALTVASLPVLFTESTSGYANAPMAAYLVLGGLAVVEGGLTSSKRELLIGGLLLGLGCWTRVEGVLYAAAIVVAGLAALAALRRPDLSWGWVLVPLGVLVAPWLVFYRLYGSDSSQAMGAFASAVKAILAGQWQLGSLRLVLEKTVRAFADAGSWRWVWVASALLVLIGFRGAPRRARLAFLAALAMGAATILVTIMLFYLGSFGTPDLRGWLDRGFDREVLASPVLILSGILLLLAPTSPSPETAGDGEGGGAGSLRQRSA